MTAATQEIWHLVGIGGIGMSALAEILLQKGESVSGSDVKEGPRLQALREKGASIHIGHCAENVPDDAALVISSAISLENPEVEEAQKNGQRVVHRAELLQELMRGHRVLAVAGTHGKTSTAALLAHVLEKSGMDPSFAVGGIVPSLGVHGKLGNGDLFVVEADESDGSFLFCNPFGAIVSNIDDDHVDHYGSPELLHAAFSTFIDQVECDDALFYWGQDPLLGAMVLKGVSYSLGAQGDIRAEKIRVKGWGTCFDIRYKGHLYRDVFLPVPGAHNVLNSLSVWGLCARMGVNSESIREAFASFQGVRRRSEMRGEKHGVMVVDDYAHHYQEVFCTLDGLRQALPDRRIIAVFQPHRYSRAKDMLAWDETPFALADEIVITDIFAAGEKPLRGVTPQSLLRELKRGGKVPARYVPRDKLVEVIAADCRPMDVVVMMGAGDISGAAGDFVEHLETHPPKKYRVALVFGGDSAEHRISMLSARNVFESLPREHFDVSCFGIYRNGVWAHDPDGSLLEKEELKSKRGSVLSASVLKELQRCDVVFPVLHGRYGEDGTIQGLFEMLSKPYVGCDFRSSAICMDKGLTKRLILQEDIPTAPWLEVSEELWQCHNRLITDKVLNQSGFPVFVKPAHLGSSIGVARVQNLDEFETVMDAIWRLDSRVVVEKEMQGRQLEFSVIGHDARVTAGPGEVHTDGAIYDYESKYGAQAMLTSAEADVPDDLALQGRELASKVFQVLGCSGMARVDFFLDKQGNYWLNEVNPIPGFTSTSLFPKVLEAHGMTSAQVLQRVIGAALRRHRLQPA